MIAPALQGATLSDGQLKDGTKGIKIDNVEKVAQPRRPVCIKMTLSLALTAIV